jgi:hypothetical protein
VKFFQCLGQAAALAAPDGAFFVSAGFAGHRCA